MGRRYTLAAAMGNEEHQPSAGRALRNRLRQLVRWVKHLRNVDPVGEMGRFQRLAARQVQVFFSVARWEVYDRLKLHAQALTYDTLLGLVPMLAVIFAVFDGFGGLEDISSQLRNLIVDNITGSPEVKAVVGEHVSDFVSNIRTGKLSIVTVLILILSVMSLLGHIEYAFNDIFGAKVLRPLPTRLLIYWAVLTLGPLLMGVSLTLTAALQSSRVSGLVSAWGPLEAFFVHATPFVVTWIAFAVMFMVVPTARVRLGAALWSAILAGTLWNLAKIGYTIYAKNAFTQQKIYGTFAAIPLFVLWLFVSWLLVLFGAQLAFAFQNAATFRREDVDEEPSHRYRERLACRVLLEVARDFVAGRAPSAPEEMAVAVGAPPRVLERVSHQLTRGGFLRTTADGAVVPGRDPHSVTVPDVLRYLHEEPGEHFKIGDDEATAELDGMFAAIDAAIAEQSGHESFRQLAERFCDLPKRSGDPQPVD